MTETSFHFRDDAGLYAFQRGLQEAFPSDCTDELGNVCPTVSGQALNLAIAVDNGNLSEEQAKERAGEEAVDVARHCRFGLGSERRCGYGVLCSMGIER